MNRTTQPKPVHVVPTVSASHIEEDVSPWLDAIHTMLTNRQEGL